MDTYQLQPQRRKAAGAALVALLLLASCTRTVYVPIENTITEYIDREVHDTTIVHEKEYIREKGDTVYKEIVRYTYIVRERTDTLIRTDSIAVPYKVEKVVEVERKPTRWERATYKAGLLLYVLALGGLLYGLYRIKRKTSS